MAIANVFRNDGWVKSPLGSAIAGAQIYVCTQPAITMSVPPSPLASIFSDVNGLFPIAQPIATDGFGHYDFYAAAGVYTVVVVYNGQIQQIYPDQSLGGVSGTSGGSGGTALALQVNGVANANQLLLNLVGQNNVTVTDLGTGTINITGSVFQTNGITNTYQALLNLVAGSGITLASDSAGDVTITSSTVVAAGTNISYAVGAPQNTSFPGLTSGQINSSGATNTFAQYIPATSLLCSPSKFTCSVWTNSASGTLTMQIVSCAKTPSTTPTVISRANITFGGNTTLTYASAAVYTSDTITFAMSPAYDYYILLNSSTGLMTYVAVQADAGLYAGGTNMLGASTLTLSGGTAEVNKTIIVALQSA